MYRRALSATVLTLTLALAPAAAWADGAGDDQYQDPLAAPTTPKKKSPTKAAPPSSTTHTTPSTTAAGTRATGATAAPATPAASNELPRTGAPAGLIGLAGAALIASGAALRRRVAA